MKSTDILKRMNALEHMVFIDMFRQGELNQNAIDRVIFVKAAKLVDEFAGSDRRRKRQFTACNAQLFARTSLHIDIRRRGGIVPGQYHGQTELNSLFLQV